MEHLSKNIYQNINKIISYMPNSSTLVKREILINKRTKCFILYVTNLCNRKSIELHIISPLLNKVKEDLETIDNPAEYIMQNYLSVSEATIIKHLDNITVELLRGKCLILIDKTNQAILCDTSDIPHRNIQESNIEKTLRGGRECFVENIEINLALIQNKVKSNKLRIERLILGTENNADAAIIYLDGVIDPVVLDTIKFKLNRIKKLPYILCTGYIEQLIEDFPYGFFPQLKNTEKPDKVVSDLFQGKAAILISGAPYALIAPAVFIEFFQGFEDYSQRILTSVFVRLTRTLSAILVLLATPIYLCVLSYTSAIVPIKLIKVIYNSRLGIPLPPFLEILTMEIAVELLREGGLRLPTPIGQTLGIVGGIVIGEAATKAGLVSPTTLVVVSTTVIASFLIPNYEMALSIRFLRFPMLILAHMFGLLGVILGFYLIVIILINMNSFGIPYFAPFAPLNYSDLKDTVIRFPLDKILRKPKSLKIKKGKI
ncbi:spore germination protein [Caloramator proteoclasticus]|uniref:GerA spore germination protein n=1 Tax=Caloramator proteoclasticus DSM 10124 TaxID=1121262 RepID=A0A1M4TQU9_9CLOT|nr:spore germination protein [Caloramator proteoclasticus]SHE46831.1 GerA spore germination protein [Caloramator proteoclasticus DSM 10124]